MNYKFGTTYDSEDFTEEEMKALENKIQALIPNDERLMGISFIYKGVLFTLDSIIYDLDNDVKIPHIRQISGKKKTILKPPIGLYKN